MLQKYFLSLALFALLFSCNGQDQRENDSSGQSPTAIKGIWNMKLSDCTTINPKGISEAPIPRELFNTIVIDDSTISFFDYPYEFVFSYTYQRSADELQLKGLSDSYEFQLKDSMLFVTETQKEGDCLQHLEKYGRSRGNLHQDTVNPRLLEALKKDTINFSMLAGKWTLSTERHLNDGSDPVKLKFSFKIPHVMNFPNQNMDTTLSKQIVSLDVNGKKKPFLISLMDDHSFWLSPWHWELDGPEMIYYKD